MKPSLKRFYLVLGIVAVAGAIALLTLATPLFATRADFSLYNPGWNGASQLGRDLHGTGAFQPLLSAASDDEGLRITPIPLADTPLDPETTALLVLGPRASYTPAEREHVRAFVEGGGLLVLADDFGTGNELLEAVNASSRFVPQRALDFAFVKRPEFTVGIDFAPHPLTQGVSRTLLNYPAALRPGPQAEVLANTTEAAWLDADEDGLRDADEPSGPFPWLAVERVGGGTVVLLADPSVLINEMRPFGDNARLAANVVAYVRADRAVIVVDESHHDITDPLGYLGVALGSVPWWLKALLALVPVAILVGFELKERRDGPGPVRRLLARLFPEEEVVHAPRALVARARERHPDWDETALKEILNEWEAAEAR